MNLKEFFLIPARYENKDFIKYDNLNLDDCANDISDYDIEIKIPSTMDLNSDLNEVERTAKNNLIHYSLSGKNRLNFSLFII